MLTCETLTTRTLALHRSHKLAQALGMDTDIMGDRTGVSERSGENVQAVSVGKSRSATDCDRGFPVKAASLDAFDFHIIAFLNISQFKKGGDGNSGSKAPEFYTLSNSFIRKHHEMRGGGRQKVRLRNLQHTIRKFTNEEGFELIAKKLRIAQPCRPTAA